jgi:hypothetical protein
MAAVGEVSVTRRTGGTEVVIRRRVGAPDGQP